MEGVIPLAPYEVNLVDEIEITAEFLSFKLEDLQSMFQAAGVGCPDVTTTTENQIVPVRPPTFGMKRGSLWFEFVCTPVPVELREAPVCYDAIPVNHPSLPFLAPSSRTLQAVAAQVPCTPTFPLTILDEGRLIAVDPHVRIIKMPARKTHHYQPLDIQLKTAPGLYTRRDLLQWRSVTMLGPMREQLTATLTFGSCKATGGCPIQTLKGGASYDFGLIKSVDHMVAQTMAWWTNLQLALLITSHVGSFGGILALLYFSTFILAYAKARCSPWSSVPTEVQPPHAPAVIIATPSAPPMQ